MSDAAGITAPAPHAGSPPRGRLGAKRRAPPEKHERRVKLREDESVAKMLFNPWDCSRLDNVTPKELWDHVAQGDEWIMFHTELAAQEASGGAYRVGVGLSRSAGVLIKCLERLESENVRLIMDGDKLDRALVEARDLLPHLRVLNFGKGSETTENASYLKTWRKQAVDARASHTEAEIKDAAKNLHAWLAKEQTPLRGILSILAGGGLFFAGYAAELTLRGWVKGGGATEATAQAAALARGLAGATGARSSGAASSDAAGIQ